MHIKTLKNGLGSLKDLIWDMFCANIVVGDMCDIKIQNSKNKIQRRGIVMLEWLGETL